MEFLKKKAIILIFCMAVVPAMAQVTQEVLEQAFSRSYAMEKYKIDNHTDHLLLDVSGFRPGVYPYFIEYGNRKSRTGKLLVK